MIYFLTSSPSLYMDGALNPANHFIDNLRRALPGRIHGVFIPTHPDDVGFSEHCSDCMRAAFEEAGIHFESYTLLDRRNAPFAESIIGGSNFVILGGGHGQLLLAAGLYFRDQVLKIHFTAPRFASFQRRGRSQKSPVC